MSDPTLPTEGSLASDATVEADPSAPSRASGAIVRGGNAPSKLGRYQVVGVLGRGGMGAVYTAEDPELGRRVAIKVLREDLAAADRDALRREAQALARLEHPNVIAVYDVGASEDRLFLVMQLVDGAPIDQWAKTATPAAIVDAFRDAGRGIAAAHEAGLVHCDIKPSNILVDRKGRVQVGDFGVARLAADDRGHVAGTPAYMAPEQHEGRATAASDQYSFCVALWEVLAGERPFAGDSKASTATEPVTAAMHVSVRPLKAPAHVQRALLRGLAADPAARFPSLTALVAALAPPRWRRFAALGALALVALGATAVVASHASHGTSAAVTPPAEAPKLGRPDVAAVRHLTNFGPTVCAYAPTVTADGTVVFDRTEGDAVDLYALPLAGGAPRRLTSGPTWEWRANAGRRAGEVIHLITPPRSTDTGSIDALDLATRAETKLHDVAANDAVAIGDAVYYTEVGAVAVRRITGARDEQVAIGPKGQHLVNLVAAPNGLRLAVAGPNDAGGSRLCWLEIATAHFECFAGKVPGGRPAFGADSRSLYYFGYDGLHRHDVVSNADELVLADANAEGGVAAAPDGSAIVISTCGSRSHLEDVSVSPPKLLVEDDTAHDATFAKDGTLVYMRNEKRHNVVMASASDGHTVQVTSASLPSVRMAAVSPDGTHVAFVQGAPHPGIHVTAVFETSFVTEVSDSPRDTAPHWIDDHTIAFMRTGDDDTPSAWIGSREGGTPRLVARSRYLIGTRRGELLVSSNEHAYWFNLATHRERSLPQGPDDATAAVVSTSGRWMAFAAGRAHQLIYRLDLDDPKAKLEQVVKLPDGETNDHLTIRDDGHVIVEPQTWSGDLIVIPAAAGTRF